MKRIIFNIALLYLMLASVQVSVMSDQCDSCGANAVCVNGDCVCPANYTGHPQFHCHHVNNLYCELLNDPILTTFGIAKIKVHVLGATRFAQFETRRSDTDQSCDFNLFAIMERLRGKIYPRSFEFELKFSNVNTSLVFKLESNRQANGAILWQYFISEQGPTALSFSVAIPFNNCTIELTETPSRFVLADIGCCGIQFGIRPYTENSLYAPGIFVEIDTNNQPTFNNWLASNEPLCLDKGSFTFADVQTALSIPDPVKAMTFHANANVAGWVSLTKQIEEYSLSEYLRACDLDRRARLSDYAWFIFTNAPLINCISKNTLDNKLLYNIITLLTNYVCNDFYMSCVIAKNFVQLNCNIAKFPYLQEYVNSSC
ncbi:unnamed protein product [Lymnaea stagnalis]|uniref:Uncharacterized protein n=1 Tax=Lymnaea stagnalis TaxID=6523 RepID=A0AAV2IDF2_LYMST